MRPIDQAEELRRLEELYAHARGGLAGWRSR
jgi:hypothetical protein